MSVIDDSESMPGFDYGTIEELDPSLGNGYRVVYDREVPFEVRSLPPGSEGGGRHQGTLELIKVKILLQGAEGSPLSIQVEMSSEADLFFHYHHRINEQEFLVIQEKQKLMVNFNDYAMVLIRMLNSCIKEPHVHLIIFTMLNDSDARLDFIQNMEYKFVELMYCQCARSSDEAIQHHITYRYNAMKQRLAMMTSRLQEINNLVKIKNPSLLLQLQKSASSNQSMTGGSNSTSSSGGVGGGTHRNKL